MFSACAKWLCAPAFKGAQRVNVFHRESEPGPDKDARLPRDVHMYARRAFRLDAVPTDARLIFSADDICKLYINGQYVCQGPAPGYPQTYYACELDVKDYLRPGENVIALHVYYQGLINRVWVSGDIRQGFILELRLNGRTTLASDENFKYLIPESRHSGPINGYDTQFNEVIDLRREPWGWRDAGFDDSAWPFCVSDPAHGHAFVLQPTPPLETLSLSPALIASGEGWQLYDLGKEAAGVVIAQVHAPSGSVIKLHAAEELDEHGRARWHTRAGCINEDVLIADGAPRQTETYDYKALRYLEVEGEGVTQLKLRAQHYPADPSACVLELHLALFGPANLLSGTLFSAVSVSSGGGCGQTCGRTATLPWNAALAALPGSVWIVALFHRKVKAVSDISTLIFCAAVDKELGLTQHGTISATFIMK